MTRSFTDWQRYGPKWCNAAVKCGGYFVAFGGVHPSNSTDYQVASVWDRSTDTVEEYSLDPVTNGTYDSVRLGCALTVGSVVYFSVKGKLGTLDPTTGVATKVLTVGPYDFGPFIRVGNRLCGVGGYFDLSTLTGGSWFASGAVNGMGTDGTRWFGLSSSAFAEFSTSTGATLSTWSTPGLSPKGSSYQAMPHVGGVLWVGPVSTTVYGFNTTTNSVVTVATTPAGFNYQSTNGWITLGGLLYDGTSASLVFDPATGQWAYDSLAMRGMTSPLFFDGSDMWAASGEPATWPI